MRALLKDLELRKVWLRLQDPAPEGRAIGYSVVKGNAQMVGRVACALGFRIVGEDLLEINTQPERR